MDIGQWFSQHQETILDYIKNIMLFGLSILGVYFGWKSIRLALPNRHHKAKLDIIRNLQKYLIENSHANSIDIRSIIESSRIDHDLAPETFSESEIYRELRASILTSHLVEGKIRETILNRLSSTENRLSWDIVEDRITALLDHEDFKALPGEGVEKIRATIFTVYKNHLELLQELQYRKLRKAFRLQTFMNRVLLILVLMLITLFIRVTPIEVLQYYGMEEQISIIMTGIYIISVYFLGHSMLKILIEKLGTIGESASQPTIDFPSWMIAFTKNFLGKKHRK